MAAKHAHHVAIKPTHPRYVVGHGAEGRYVSVNEVVRIRLRLRIDRNGARGDAPGGLTFTKRSRP